MATAWASAVFLLWWPKYIIFIVFITYIDDFDSRYTFSSWYYLVCSFYRYHIYKDKFRMVCHDKLIDGKRYEHDVIDCIYVILACTHNIQVIIPFLRGKHSNTLML